MALRRRKTPARGQTLRGERSPARFRDSLPVALIVLFVAGYVAAALLQAIELFR